MPVLTVSATTVQQLLRHRVSQRLADFMLLHGDLSLSELSRRTMALGSVTLLTRGPAEVHRVAVKRISIWPQLPARYHKRESCSDPVRARRLADRLDPSVRDKSSQRSQGNNAAPLQACRFARGLPGYGPPAVCLLVAL